MTKKKSNVSSEVNQLISSLVTNKQRGEGVEKSGDNGDDDNSDDNDDNGDNDDNDDNDDDYDDDGTEKVDDNDKADKTDKAKTIPKQFQSYKNLDICNWLVNNPHILQLANQMLEMNESSLDTPSSTSASSGSGDVSIN